MNIPMEINAVFSDPHIEAQVVVLQNNHKETLLPIWVGTAEANAIRLAMEHITIPRPLTHDLLKSFLTHLNVHLEKAVIHKVHRNTYYASLYLKRSPIVPMEYPHDEAESFRKETPPDKEEDPRKSLPTDFQVDARPSDAMVLALRYGAPLYVSETVLDQPDVGRELSEWLDRTQSKNADADSSV